MTDAKNKLDAAGKSKTTEEEDLDTPTKGHNPRHDGKHEVKSYEAQRGGSKTLPKPTAAAASNVDAEAVTKEKPTDDKNGGK